MLMAWKEKRVSHKICWSRLMDHTRMLHAPTLHAGNSTSLPKQTWYNAMITKSDMIMIMSYVCVCVCVNGIGKSICSKG